jgi:hypothetical protein
VPKLWTETIEEHRRAVGDAILDTTATLVAEHGLGSATMSQVATEAGIGRARRRGDPRRLARTSRRRAPHPPRGSPRPGERSDRTTERVPPRVRVHDLSISTPPGHRNRRAGAPRRLALAQKQLQDLIRDLL